MINSLNGEYRSIAAKYDDVLGIMVISRMLATVHHAAMYDPFEHRGMLRWVSLSSV